MKHHLKLICAAVTALGLPVAASAALTLTQAQITQIIKDVKTIDPAKGARAAVLKETLQGAQSVRTGVDSRAELFFNDHTITRLGANTHFSFTEGTRNMSLESGVMLLQVPKGIGGAKIQTAAVTAAVTGTTIMLETFKNYSKLLVLEGEAILYSNNKNGTPSNHKVHVSAGQELILRNGSTVIPQPFYVNLKILESTSLLITGNWGAPLDTTPLLNAMNGQGPKNFINTNLAIIGAGTDVTVIQNQTQGQNQQPPPQNNQPVTTISVTPPTSGPPSEYGPPSVISNSSNYVIDANTTISLDPTVTAAGVTGYGKIYRGPVLDGEPTEYLFGAGSGISFPDLKADNNFPNYGVAAFEFESLNIEGMPILQTSGNGPHAIALVSESYINISAPIVSTSLSEGYLSISAPTSTTLDFSQVVDQLYLFATGGNIDLGANMTIAGLKELDLYSFGAADNIIVDGVVNLSNDGSYNFDNLDNSGQQDNGNHFSAETQGSFGGAGTINNAEEIDIHAGGVLTLTETNIEDVQTDMINGVAFSLDAPLNELDLTGNEIDVPNGFNGWPAGYDSPTVDLDLTATSGNGLLGDITLSGAINVDNLNATADDNITVTEGASINSNNSVQFSAGNSVEIDGAMTANEGSITLSASNNVIITGGLTGNAGTQIVATNGNVDIEGSVTDYSYISVYAGGGITAGVDSYIYAGNYGDGPVSFTSANCVMLNGGEIWGGDVNITSQNVSTGAGLSLYGSNSITISAASTVTLGGYIQTPTLTVQGVGNDGSVPATATIPAGATIYADNFNINAGIVNVDGSITADNDDAGGNTFSVDTTSGTGALNINNQDFSGSDNIDAGTIQINSRGDLILDSVVAQSPNVNGVGVNPSGNLQYLNLTGATIEVPDGFSVENEYGVTLALTANTGDISIGGSINVTSFYASTPTQINISGEGTGITADFVTLNIPNRNGTLTQDSDSPTTYYYSEYTTGSSPALISTISITPGSALTLMGNSLTVGNINVPEGADLDLNLTSANDINATSSGTVITANADSASIELQVGVDATLAGDGGSNITYKTGQLTIDTTNLNIFSLTAASIQVNSGFPTLASASALELTANGENGITVNAALNVQNGYLSLTANNGAITVYDALSAGDGDLDLTANNGITVNPGSPLSSAGNMNLTAYNGDVVLQGSLDPMGDLNINAYNGGININVPDLNVGGSFTAYASNNIVFSLADPYVGGSLSLTAGGAIELDNSLTIGGLLTLNAGTYIHSPTSGNVVIGGASSVTLSLGAPAEISEDGELHKLYFGVPAASEETGYGPIAIDLTSAISVSSPSYPASVFAIATQLTLTSDFNEPDLYLSLGATSGNLVIDGAVTTPGFSGYASGIITGTGSINANTVFLGQGGAATLGQPQTDLLSFDGLGINVNPGEGGAASVFLAASQLTLTDPIAIPETDLDLFGAYLVTGSVPMSGTMTINTQGYTITAQNVYLGSLQTAYDLSGNGTNLDVIASSLSLGNVSLDGSVAGSGGTFTGTTSSGSAMNIYGPVTANGGPSGGNGGAIDLTSGGDIDVSSGTLFVSGSDIFPFEFNGSIAANGGGAATGGTVNLNSQGDINLNSGTFLSGSLSNTAGSITANGGSSGGKGGTVTLTSGGNINVNSATILSGLLLSNNSSLLSGTAYFNGYITANGGDANPESSATGGNGGTVDLTTTSGSINIVNSGTFLTGTVASGTFLSGSSVSGTVVGGTFVTGVIGTSFNSSIAANGGAGGATGGGGNGGSVTLNSGGDINVSNSISANGGNAGASSSAAGGNGGTITLIAGGNINLYQGGNLSATSGINGNVVWTGGNGGTVNLTAQGTINISSTVEVSSSNLLTNRVSAKGGNVNVTSHAATGNVAINVTDSGQIAALLNQAASGTGGTITFLADKGGSAKISGNLRADGGTINIQTGTVDGAGVGGPICLNGANLSADVVKVGSLGANGSLIIGNSTINGDTAIKLYAAGDNGSVVFAGNTYLSGAGLKSIAGSAVTINNGVFVNVTGGAATVYTNQANYTGSGGNGATTGHFSGNTNTTTQPFANRPAF